MTIDDRLTMLEGTAYRHGEHLLRHDAAKEQTNGTIEQINRKLDDLSGWVRENHSIVIETLADHGARLASVEVTLERHGAMLERLVNKLGA
jgi:hypothetical protein